MSFSGGEVFVGMASGIGTAAVTTVSIYIGRKVRKISARIEEVMRTPAELEGLRTVVATNTQAISNLSEALNRLTMIAQQRVNGG